MFGFIFETTWRGAFKSDPKPIFEVWEINRWKVPQKDIMMLTRGFLLAAATRAMRATLALAHTVAPAVATSK